MIFRVKLVHLSLIKKFIVFGVKPFAFLSYKKIKVQQEQAKPNNFKAIKEVWFMIVVLENLQF